jgi:hypothetical protein
MHQPSEDKHGVVSGDRLVHALVRGGFVVFRRHQIATILERGPRAVAVPNLPDLPPQAVQSVRLMSGLSVPEFAALLQIA